MANKGSPYEREICARLSEWWSNDRRTDIFYRTAGSGGRATNRAKRNRKTVNSHGDIGALDPIGEPFLRAFATELKRGYSKHTIADLLDRNATAKQQQWDAWIEQAIRSQVGSGAASWLIISRRDKRQSVVAMEGRVFEFIEEECLGYTGAFSPVLTFRGPMKDEEYQSVVMVLLEDFLDHVTPAHIKKLLVDFP